MLHFKSLITSELTSVDKDTGNLSIFNILTDISVHSFPVVINNLAVTIILEQEGDGTPEGVVELLIRQENAPDIIQKLPFVLEKSQIMNLVIRVKNFVAIGPGKIEFVAKFDNKEIKNTITARQVAR